MRGAGGGGGRACAATGKDMREVGVYKVFSSEALETEQLDLLFGHDDHEAIRVGVESSEISLNIGGNKISNFRY